MSFVKVNDVNLYYRIEGHSDLTEDARYLLVLHGGPGVSDHSLYYDFWVQFSDLVYVVFFDMRGHGQSEKGDLSKWNLEQWGQDVNDFCDALRIKNPIIAGVSFGGWVALSYALQYPESTSKLILCNTEACIDNAAQIEVYTQKGGTEAGEVIRKIYEEPSAGLWGEYIKYCAEHMSKNPYKEVEIKRVRPNMDLYHNFYKTQQHLFDYLPKLPALVCSILILGGTDDPEHPLRSTLTMSNALINAKVQLEVMDGAGDPVYRDFPELTKNIVAEFISRS